MKVEAQFLLLLEVKIDAIVLLVVVERVRASYAVNHCRWEGGDSFTGLLTTSAANPLLLLLLLSLSQLLLLLLLLSNYYYKYYFSCCSYF